ncbi:MAG: ribbon-helix-helix protein, CopG family [Gammaproteobacteria bacterium]|nr:ribbon-helix-helix protein, CopG family [Gammaproteobacteria bacterium]
MKKSTIKNTTISQKKSDAKRGVKTKAFKLPLQTIANIEAISTATGKPHNAIIVELINKHKEELGL